MLRMLCATILAVLATAIAQAHFPFILPDSEGRTAKVVFSDELKPDTMVNVEKLAGTKLTLRDARGKESPLEWKKAEGFYQVAVPGSGSRTVYGVTEYGVLQKGNTKPFRLTYLPKAMLGPIESPVRPIGGPLKVEILPLGEVGKTRFQVIHAGKPAPAAEVTILLPQGGKKAVKTDPDGLTPTFEATGRYGVYARVTENKSGEFAGKKFDEIRYYATLVIDVAK